MKDKFMHVTFNTLQISGEFSFLVTANGFAPCLTGGIRAQWNFRGAKLPGAWGRIGKEWVLHQEITY